MLLLAARRVLSGVALIIVVLTAAFALVFGSGADAARTLLSEGATAVQVAEKEAELGLDRPLLTQYASWLMSALHGDLGRSWFAGEPVIALLAARLPATLSLVVPTIAVTAALSAIIGTVAAVRGGWTDRVLQVVAVIGFALPSFWIALLLVSWFAVSLGWLPATGYVPLTEDPGGWARAVTLPVVALSIGSIAATAQQVRGATVDVLRQDFVRTLRSRGLSEFSVVGRHALRNAAGPALTILSLQFITLLGGAVTIEKVFAIPGMGTLTTDAALRGDIPVIMGVVAVMVVLVVAVNTLTGVVARLLDPRIRAS